MKNLLLLFVWMLSIPAAYSQGTVNLAPVPVTNGLTATLAGGGFLGGVYFGVAGTPESNFLLIAPPVSLVNGYADFGAGLGLPLPGGTIGEFQVRAWSAGYPDYESAVGSGLASVLAGKSETLTATLGGGGPPPVPNPLVFPGFTISPVPEPSGALLGLTGVLFLALRRVIAPTRDAR